MYVCRYPYTECVSSFVSAGMASQPTNQPTNQPTGKWMLVQLSALAHIGEFIVTFESLGTPTITPWWHETPDNSNKARFTQSLVEGQN